MNHYQKNIQRFINVRSFMFFVMLCGLLAIPNNALAQTNQVKSKVISGVVTDANGDPVIGATVMAKGSKKGTVTDLQGHYTLTNVPENSTITISYIGYQKQTIKASDADSLSKIVMKEDATSLDDVVVLGYGNVRRRDVTGSVASVSSEAISKVASSSVVDAIEGKMAGVSITTADGDPDAEIMVRVRGGGSITQDNSPLYIVDGFPVDNLKGIPPTDIESIDVLKEASMTAIYGARGANGVVIVTTKNAKSGKTQVQFNSYLQARTLARKIPVMGNYEYVMSDYEYEMIRGGSVDTFNKNFGFYDDLDLYKYLPTNDWQDKMLGGHPMSQSHNVVVRGGSNTTMFNLSYTYNKDEGQLIGSGLSQNNINLKLNHQIFKNLRLETNSTYHTRTINGAGTGGVSILNALRYRPTNGLSVGYMETEEDEENLDAQGNTLNVKYAPTDENVQNYKKQGTNDLSLRAALIWDVAKGWQFRSEYGISNSYSYANCFYGALSGVAASAGMNNMPSASKSKTHSESYRLANTLTYQNIFNKKHNLNVLIGQEINSSQYDNVFTSVRYYPVSITAEAALENFSLGTPNQSTSYKSAPVRTASFFGRALYNYKSLYYATFTMRADGSTKFAPGKQWGYFPAASVAWRLSNEKWMKPVTFVSDLKLRASLGRSGNNRIGDDLWHSVYRVYNGSSAPGFNNQEYNYYQFANQTYLYDPDLKWETTITRNLGLDFSLFDSRLSGTVDVYKNTTKDLLVPSVIPNSTGFSRQMTNIGQTTNRGLEITLNGQIVKSRDFNLSANFDIAFNKNRVDKLANGETEWKLKASLSDWYGTYNYKLEVGKTMGLIYGFVNDGFYTTDDFNFDPVTNKWTLKDGIADDSKFSSGNFAFKPGAMKLKKLSNSDSYYITEDDMTKIGDTNPKATGGFGITANYKNIDLTAYFTYMLDFDVFNVNKLYLRSALRRNYSNLSCDMDLAHRYRYVDDNGVNVSNDPVALAELNKNASTYSWMSLTQGITMTDLIEDGTFLRLSTLTIGYTLPTKLVRRVGINNLRFYLSSNNLFLLTKYSGFDPEVNVQNGLTPGVDSNRYPRSRTFTVGVNLTF
jgi:TonB-linked SusC/RagA family outer membrane protein